jgi:hypothetical protein
MHLELYASVYSVISVSRTLQSNFQELSKTDFPGHAMTWNFDEKKCKTFNDSLQDACAPDTFVHTVDITNVV